MTFYVCKQCNYKHTFQPLACARCKGTNFYPLITTEWINPITTTNDVEVKGYEVRTDNTETLYNALEKLDKAKELLKEFMRISVASVEEYEREFSELVGEAENFLNKE